MTANITVQDILTRFDTANVKAGDIKKIAKEIKTDHDLATALWGSENFHARRLAVLIMDKKLLTQQAIDQLIDTLTVHEVEQQIQIVDWLLANQLTKSKPTLALLDSWEKASAPMLRRLFWYHQARLRWTGKTPPENTPDLMESLETELENAEPEVQWAMNFAAGQIGIHEPEYRERCIALGERLGLYRDDPVPRGCTPNYLPTFIRIEVDKRES